MSSLRETPRSPQPFREAADAVWEGSGREKAALACQGSKQLPGKLGGCEEEGGVGG